MVHETTASGASGRANCNAQPRWTRLQDGHVHGWIAIHTRIGQARVPDHSRLKDGLDPSENSALRALAGAVAMLVLIACLNVSGLMTARCLDRARDIGLRRAIGGRARDIIALLLAEHLVLFVAGSVIAAFAAAPLLRLVVALLPPSLNLLKMPVLDLRVAAFVALSVFASLAVASVWPVRRALKLDLQQIIVCSGGAAVTPRTSGWGFRLVTAGQVAGSIVLVIAGGLLVGSLVEVRANKTGYRIDDLVVAELAFTPQMDGNPAWDRRSDIKILLNQLLDELNHLPFVVAAGAADMRVLESSLIYASRFDPVNPVVPPDSSLPPGATRLGDSGGLRIPVTAGFFRAAGVTPVEGRLPTDDELRSGAPMVAISRSYARQHFPGRNPIGERLRNQPVRDYPTFEIVGVVDDPRLMEWDARASSAVFAPCAWSRAPDRFPCMAHHLAKSKDPHARLRAHKSTFRHSKELRAIQIPQCPVRPTAGRAGILPKFNYCLGLLK